MRRNSPLFAAAAAVALGAMAGSGGVTAQPASVEQDPAKAKTPRVARHLDRWASIRANIGRRHPDYGLSPADHAGQKVERGYPATRRPTY